MKDRLLPNVLLQTVDHVAHKEKLLVSRELTDVIRSPGLHRGLEYQQDSFSIDTKSGSYIASKRVFVRDIAAPMVEKLDERLVGVYYPVPFYEFKEDTIGLLALPVVSILERDYKTVKIKRAPSCIAKRIKDKALLLTGQILVIPTTRPFWAVSEMVTDGNNFHFPGYICEERYIATLHEAAVEHGVFYLIRKGESNYRDGGKRITVTDPLPMPA